MSVVAWIIFFIGALLEVAGNAAIRIGLRGGGAILILIGCALLGSYGLVVNTVQWDFSKIFGVYVCLFALVSVLCGKFVLRENIPGATWLGLGVILTGGLIIQFGSQR
jgi:drug/metabolite transporter superfamily protein YnfA